jgi:hypothetical protein
MEWQEGQAGNPRIHAVTVLLTELTENDSRYLGGEINREKWIEVAKGIDERLTVAGLRLAIRPWAQSGR